MEHNTPDLNTFASMVSVQDRGKIRLLGGDNMGIIPEDLDTQFEETEVGSGGGSLPAGDYEGVVTDVKLGASEFRTWRTAELSGKITVDAGDSAGRVTFFDVEAAPLTNKEGAISPGKMKFLKWQLEALGYTGKLSELEDRYTELEGARVSFEQKDEDSGKPNPKTGQNYRDREATLKDNLTPGYGTPATSSVSTDDGEQVPVAAPVY